MPFANMAPPEIKIILKANEVNMKKSLSKTRKYHYILYIVPILSILTVLKTSALTYQSDTNIDFTINPTISMTLSGDLIIDNLTPGSSSDSNIIEVGVSTNASHGYYLSATVGSSSTDTNLTNSDNSNYTFTNLSSNASSLSNFSDNEWGYSYSTDGGTNWISGSQGSTLSGYNGLPLDGNDSGATGITLVDTTTPLATNQVKFKIGAKASNAQASGTYTNTINFYAITRQAPITFDDAFAAAGKTKYLGYYKMQDMDSTICSATEVYDELGQTKLIDIRDNKIYWITKLQDNNCWMTQNLDLDLTSGVALTSETTDLTTSGTAPYIEGYSNDNGVISWTPQDWTATATSGGGSVSATTRTPAGTSFSNWVNGSTAEGADQYKDGYIHPLSADPGNWYQTGTYFNSEACNYLTDNCSNFSTASFVANGTHGHVGNYYNWTAVIASNDSYGATGSQHNSICPKGWRLPVNGEYGILNIKYNGGLINEGGQGRDEGLFDAPLYLTRAGLINGGLLRSSGYNGYYWSSTAYNSAGVSSLNFYSTYVNPAHNLSRWYGFSLRCLARD